MAITFRERVQLASYTTLRVGGPAHYFGEANTLDDIKQAGIFAQQKSLPLFVLGGGSNILVSDQGLPGVVVKMNLRGTNIARVSEGQVELTAAAGEVFDDVVAFAVGQQLWGIENLSHVPGSVGATPIQNVGAYGVEVATCIARVETIHVPSLQTKIFTRDECQFGYRDSFFKTPVGREYVVVAVTFLLHKDSSPYLHYHDLATFFSGTTTPNISDVRQAVIEIRSKKFPDWTQTGTAGSFFKNPVISRTAAEGLRVVYPELPLYDVSNSLVKCSLGYVLDKVCGLKGYGRGRVRLYEKQALVLVAETGASADDIKNFVDEITEIVFLKTKIVIECEVTIPLE